MLESFKGQDEAIAQLKVEIAAAKAGSTTLPHMLFLGPPGTGKTTLARELAAEMALPFEVLHCPNVSDRAVVADKIVAAQGGILFCEEIHGLPRLFAEDMYTVIDDAVVHRTVEVTTPVERVRIKEEGIGFDRYVEQVPTGRYEFRREPITPVTVVGATTDEAMLPEAFLSRLSGLVVRLQPYTTEALAEIGQDHATDRYGMALMANAARFLAKVSRQNPRRLKQLVDRTFATGLAQGAKHYLTEEHALRTVRVLKIDDNGLEEPHRKVLQLLSEQPLSRTSLAQRMGIPAKNFDLYWSDLTRLGFATIGRKHEITAKGRDAIAT